MFKAIKTSRKKGLLKSSFNSSLIALHIILAVAAVVTVLGAIATASVPLNLRYSSEIGPYDRGEWLRTMLLAAFVVIHVTATMVIAHRLLPLKRPSLVTGFLVSSLLITLMATIISLQYAAYARI